MVGSSHPDAIVAGPTATHCESLLLLTRQSSAQIDVDNTPAGGFDHLHVQVLNDIYFGWPRSALSRAAPLRKLSLLTIV